MNADGLKDENVMSFVILEGVLCATFPTVRYNGVDRNRVT